MPKVPLKFLFVWFVWWAIKPEKRQADTGDEAESCAVGGILNNLG